VAFGTTAPVLSVTVPNIVAVLNWAKAVVNPVQSNSAMINAQLRTIRIL
jgi:hypothetical protein